MYKWNVWHTASKTVRQSLLRTSDNDQNFWGSNVNVDKFPDEFIDDVCASRVSICLRACASRKIIWSGAKSAVTLCFHFIVTDSVGRWLYFIHSFGISVHLIVLKFWWRFKRYQIDAINMYTHKFIVLAW